jgi:hypothetical protein
VLTAAHVPQFPKEVPDQFTVLRAMFAIGDDLGSFNQEGRGSSSSANRRTVTISALHDRRCLKRIQQPGPLRRVRRPPPLRDDVPVPQHHHAVQLDGRVSLDRVDEPEHGGRIDVLVRRDAAREILTTTSLGTAL